MVVLIGLPGVGKSSIGRRAARRLDWTFIDLDIAIESKAGMSIREVFAAAGEQGFRDLESEMLTTCLASETPCIVATGGGIVLRAENRQALKRADMVVLVSASLEELEQRLAQHSSGSRSHRPLLDGDLRQNLTKLDQERSSLYRDAATDHLSTSGTQLTSAVGRLVEMIMSEFPSYAFHPMPTSKEEG